MYKTPAAGSPTANNWQRPYGPANLGIFTRIPQNATALFDRATAAGSGADRDRTGDLKLAKLALSQLSYGPDVCLAPALSCLAARLAALRR